MKVSVPIYIPANSQVSDNLKPRLIELNAKQVILCLGFQKDISSAKNALVSIKSYAEKISFWGYEVAIWVRTLDVLEKPSYKKLTDFNGKTLNSWKCPLCMEFREDYLSLITEQIRVNYTQLFRKYEHFFVCKRLKLYDRREHIAVALLAESSCFKP